jgi:hypothetical protein
MTAMSSLAYEQEYKFRTPSSVLALHKQQEAQTATAVNMKKMKARYQNYYYDRGCNEVKRKEGEGMGTRGCVPGGGSFCL